MCVDCKGFSRSNFYAPEWGYLSQSIISRHLRDRATLNIPQSIAKGVSLGLHIRTQVSLVRSLRRVVVAEDP